MTCFLPAPEFYRFVMHNLHFISTPIYIITLITLFRESSQVFQKYKYYLIGHVLTNFLSEAYVTFMWLPTTHLPYDVHKSTGWLAEWGFSGSFQFMTLAQFIIFIGVSIMEMFYHRFKVVIDYKTASWYMKLPRFGFAIFRIFTFIALVLFVWSISSAQTLAYQQMKKDELARKEPNLPHDILCYTVFILAPEDPILVISVVFWGILAIFGCFVVFSSVIITNHFLNTTMNLSKETKKMQKMLIISLLVQASIHSIMIVFPVSAQIYQMIFGLYNNDFANAMLFFLAYHGFFSTCAMIMFTKQIRLKVFHFLKLCFKPKPASVRPKLIQAVSVHIESNHN